MVIHVFVVLLTIFDHIKRNLLKTSYDNCFPNPISSFQFQVYGLMGYEEVLLFIMYIKSLLIAQILQRPTTAQLVSKKL